MKKIIAFCLGALFVFAAGCDTVLNQPQGGNDISEAENSRNISAPDEISKVEAPDETVGVWFVSTAEELAAIDFGDYEGVPTVCITDAFVTESETVFQRPVSIYYTADTFPAETDTGILISTREAGEIRIKSSTSGLFASGLLTIDAPECTVVWEGENTPDERDIQYFCNVKQFNGKEYAEYGGSGNGVIENIDFPKFEGCTFFVRGNVAYLGYPLIAGDSDLENAVLEITCGGETRQESYDLTKQHAITVTDESGNTRTYLLAPVRISFGLPVMQIYTDGNKAIDSKLNYVDGKMYIDGTEYGMQIRGRGNASWNTFPKKSYRIKLVKGASLFGLEKNRDWVLTCNYTDKTLIRNAVAHDIASVMDGLDFTSTHISVNLYINGKYVGVYTFADKIEEGAGRLDFTDIEGDEPNGFGGLDIGFLIEIGWDFDGENIYNKDYFDSKKVLRIYVKEPESDRANTPEFTYAKKYILAMEQAIINNDGWQDFIDLDSWVDWFIVSELTFNTESCYYRSCYMWKRAGGKLMMGPVWDFDMAFGNHLGDIYNYDGFCTTESTYQYIKENWMDYLITYDEFNDAVKERWNEKKDELLQTALASVDKHSSALEGSQQQNFTVWNIMTQQIGMGKADPKKYDTYEKQVQYLRDFINTRWNYLDERINREF